MASKENNHDSAAAVCHHCGEEISHCPKCGAIFGRTKKRQRSVPHHRRFFALIKQAFLQWPETHERQFLSAEELRKWLIVKAGHRTLYREVDVEGMPRDVVTALVETAFMTGGAGCAAEIQGTTMLFFRPKSISFSALGQREFSELSAQIEEIIEHETGIDPRKLVEIGVGI
jgi:hypothetical protein